MSDSRHQFDNFELNWNTRELFRDGKPVAIEPKTLELIHYLLLHRDRAVAKDELARALWPDRVISDAVISQTVRKARVATGDDGSRQDVIQTVRGYGYRFIAEVTSIGTSPTASPSPTPGTTPSARQWQVAAWSATLVLALALGLAWLWPEPTFAPQTQSVAIAPTIKADNLPDAPDWLEFGLPRLLGYGLASLPGLMVLGDAIGGVPDEEAEIDWIRDALRADEIVQPIVMFENNEWQLDANILGRDGTKLDRLSFSHEQLAVALSQLTKALNTRYRPSGVSLPEEPFSADPWVNESLARTFQALEAGDPALAVETAALILSYEPDHPWARHFHASALRQTGENRAALAKLEALLADPALEAAPGLAVEVNNSIGVVAHQLGEVEKALGHFEAAAALAEQADNPRQLAQALLSQGVMLSALDEPAAATQRYEQSMRIFTRIGYQPGRALVANSLGARAWRDGDVELSAHWHRQALEIRRRYGRRSEVAQSLLNLSTTTSARMQFDQTRQLIEEALLLTEAHGLADMHTWALVQLGHLQVRTGELARARQSLEQGLERAEAMGYAQARASALGGLGRLAAHERDFDRGRQLLLDTLATFEAMPHVRTRLLDARLDLAELALNHGETTEAAHWLAELEDELGSGNGPDLQSATWFHLMAQLSAERGEPEQALALLEQGLDHARRVNQLEPRVMLIGELVKVALRLDDLDRAEAAIADIPTDLDSHWRTLVMHAALSHHGGDPSASLDLLEQAHNQAGERWPPRYQALLEDRRRTVADMADHGRP